jgi:hypothetical protein
LSAAFLLGRDVAEHIGAERIGELDRRWPGPREGELSRRMDIPGSPLTWTLKYDRRSALVDAMRLGWSTHI